MAKKRKGERSRDNRREVNWVLCLVMSVVFGGLGVDRFIMGKIGTGILKLITFGGIGIWWLVDVILIATKYQYKGVKWIE
jgi:TM2 domain-containing membrane protein YozV